MKLLSLIFVAVATISAADNAVAREYTTRGMQGLRLFCDTEAQLNYLHKFASKEGFDFTQITREPSVPVEVLVAAHRLLPFKRDLNVNGIRYEVVIQDAFKAANKEAITLKSLEKSNKSILDTFPKYEEVVEYLKALGEKAKSKVEYFSLGESSEGREIAGVKISNGGADDKPAVFIDAGIHAREWIAPTTALYAINELATNAELAELLERVDFYVVPVLNPDGYSYTHLGSNSRLWRKTRSKTSSKRCLGVDANRNFDYHWMEIGASSDPCSETYAGDKAFSEPETLALKNFLLDKKSVKVYLTLHSYGNYLLHPWGYTSALPENEPVLREVAEEAASSLAKIRGTSYEIGSSTNVLYAAAGGSDDYAMGVVGAELSYTIELPSNRFGFAPPPSEILPVGQETFEAIKVFAEYAANDKDVKHSL